MATDSQDQDDSFDSVLGSDASTPSHDEPLNDELSQIDALIRADAAESGLDTSGDAATEPAAKPEDKQDTNANEDSATRDASPEKDEGGGVKDEEKQKDTEAKDKQSEEEDPDAGKSKFAKEQARKERSWKALQDEKEAFRKEREAIVKERDELRAANERIKAEAAKRTQSAHTAEEYAEFAKAQTAEADQLEARGDYETAAKKRQLALAAREEADAVKAQEAEAAQREHASKAELNAKRLELWEQAKKEVPELTQSGSAEQAIAREVLTEMKHLKDVPELPLMAAKYAKAQAQASRVPELEEELESARAKIKELEEATALPGGSGPGAPPAERSFSQMSIEEQEKALERELMNA